MRRRAGWLVIGVLAGVAGAGLIFWPRPPTPSVPSSAPLPPLTGSPFLNARTDVAYVGDARCVGCHREESKAYRQHPMSRSLFAAADAPVIEDHDTKANTVFQAGRFQFEVLRRDGKVIQRSWCADAKGKNIADQEAEVAYAVGSGAQARSYLIERDGFLFQAPITWYVQKARWELSPGYEANPQQFSRRIEHRCLYCHAHEARPIAASVNHYEQPPFGQLAIGCERCHGPGALHVTARQGSPPEEEIDRTIVNPRHLAASLREAICEQCHLQGEALVVRRGRVQADYRPGLPLHEYLAAFVRPPELGDATLIVGHVEQMHQSACFKQSAGKFGCTSCHDPHRAPVAAERIAFYRDRCETCHGAAERPAGKRPAVKAPACALPLAQRNVKEIGNDCLTCHMPRRASSAGMHLAVTDHRVLRDPDRPPALAPEPGRGDAPLLAFHRRLMGPTDEELPRDLGLALIPLAAAARDQGGGDVSDYLTRRALPLLDDAVRRAPDDVPALEGRGFALYAQSRFAEAVQALESAVARAPDREQGLSWAFDAALAHGRVELAEKHARRLVAKYPHFAGHHERLALALMEKGNWTEALAAARAAHQRDPFRPEPRALAILIHLERGERDQARAEFDALGAIDPDYLERLRPRLAGRLD